MKKMNKVNCEGVGDNDGFYEIATEASESTSTPCSDTEFRRALILGAFSRAKGHKVGDNPYSENDERHWRWMQGWTEAGGLQL